VGTPHRDLGGELVSKRLLVDMQAPFGSPCKGDRRQVLVVAGDAFRLIPDKAVVDEAIRRLLEQVDRPLEALPQVYLPGHPAGCERLRLWGIGDRLGP